MNCIHGVSWGFPRAQGKQGCLSGRGLGYCLFPLHPPPSCLKCLLHTLLSPWPGFPAPPIPFPGASHQQFLVLGLEFTVLLLRTEPRAWVRAGVQVGAPPPRGPPHPCAHTLPPSLVRWGLMALTSLWKMLCCSTWWSTSGRSDPKLWLLSLSWPGGQRDNMHEGGPGIQDSQPTQYWQPTQYPIPWEPRLSSSRCRPRSE